MTSPVSSHWPIYKSLPEGWKFDRVTGSPLAGYLFATDGKSVLHGQKRALVAVPAQPQKPKEYAAVAIDVTKPAPRAPINQATRQAMNALAREQFKKKLLKDLAVDLMVCKIEGWAIDEYIAELHALINGVYESMKPTQEELFK
jgi:hypothetical protein